MLGDGGAAEIRDEAPYPLADARITGVEERHQRRQSRPRDGASRTSGARTPAGPSGSRPRRPRPRAPPWRRSRARRASAWRPRGARRSRGRRRTAIKGGGGLVHSKAPSRVKGPQPGTKPLRPQFSPEVQRRRRWLLNGITTPASERRSPWHPFARKHTSRARPKGVGRAPRRRRAPYPARPGVRRRHQARGRRPHRHLRERPGRPRARSSTSTTGHAGSPGPSSARPSRITTRRRRCFPRSSGCRFVWIADLLPHEIAGNIRAMIEQGTAVIKGHAGALTMPRRDFTVGRRRESERRRRNETHERKEERVFWSWPTSRGFTAFLTSTELEHGPAIIAELLDEVIRRIAPPLRYKASRATPSFALGPNGTVLPPASLLEVLRADSRGSAPSSAELAADFSCGCPCCRERRQAPPESDRPLRTVRRARDRRTGASRGPDVILAHRMLKNGVANTADYTPPHASGARLHGRRSDRRSAHAAHQRYEALRRPWVLRRRPRCEVVA